MYQYPPNTEPPQNTKALRVSNPPFFEGYVKKNVLQKISDFSGVTVEFHKSF